MKEAIFGILIILWLAVSILWAVALMKPRLNIFNKLKPRFKGRKGLSKFFAPLFVGTFILLAVFAPPIEAELKSINLEADQEVIAEQFTIEGEVAGDFVTFKINDESITSENNKFTKTLDLQPGNNEVRILLTRADEEGNEVDVYNKSHNVYFDYEGMLYAQELEKDKRAEEELKRKLAEVPQYETVRKTDIDNGFSAIVYVEGDMEDYQISNVVKDLRNKHPDSRNISALLFSKSNKSNVEAILENSSPAELVTYIRANYEKREDKQQLFWFPKGAEGEKLALEIL
jgi:hypothetical protein